MAATAIFALQNVAGSAMGRGGSASEGVCFQVGSVSGREVGLHLGGGVGQTPTELEERTVRILLECFLVLHKIAAALFAIALNISTCHHDNHFCHLPLPSWMGVAPICGVSSNDTKLCLATPVWMSFNSLHGLFGLLWDQASLMRNNDHDYGTVKCPKMKPISSEFYVHKQSLNWSRKRKIKSRTKLDLKLQSFANMEICLTWWVNLSSIPNKLNKYQLLNL